MRDRASRSLCLRGQAVGQEFLFACAFLVHEQAREDFVVSQRACTPIVSPAIDVGHRFIERRVGVRQPLRARVVEVGGGAQSLALRRPSSYFHPRMTELTIAAPALLEGLPEAALIVADGRVLAANAAARSLLGGDVQGSALDQVISHPAALEALDRSSIHSADGVELTGLGGSRRHWLMRSAPLDENSSLVRFLDRSEVAAAEQMRVDFVANASHELRTPLSTLIGYTETLREQADEIDPDTRERFLSVVHDEARRMQRVVEDLISLSRIEAEKFTAPTEAIALEPLIDRTLDAARRLADERGSVLIREVADALPRISADSGQILQLLDNLVENALRYGEQSTPVAVSAHAEGPMVHLAVSDQGEGIAPEHIGRITERFYRVDTGRSRSLGGTGLGLAIVKHIVERHRGRLSIESELGKGTCVHVLLPAAVS
ncbi:MAG TPA: ATP-binding protein [Burkholderiales bacterium]|nr:ATP-binding protein [Burkholderiales bacterium]